MGRSQNSFLKKQKEKQKAQKKKEKQERKEERKANAQGGGLDNMMAYVDSFGNISDTPIDEETSKKENQEFEIQVSVPKSEDNTNVERRGKVDFFDAQKGFGFIIQDGSQEKFFIHESNAIDPLREGSKVAFKIQKGLKGMDAVEVKSL